MRRLTSVLFAFFLLSSFGFAQESIDDENWLKGFKTEADYLEPLVYWDMKSFTLDDVARGKVRLKTVRQFAPQNEWEGTYYANTFLGDNKFIWNASGGFFSFYFYHTLKSLTYGKATDTPAFIDLEYEKLPFSLAGKKPGFKSKLVKVRIGKTRFLVPENRLEDFCDRAVGLNTDSDDVLYYWMKETEQDSSERLEGLPVLPAGYQKFLRHPIEATLVSVGKRKIIPNEHSTKEYNYDDIHYQVTINAGRNKRVKKDMNFFVKDLGEWIQLTYVGQKTSVGFIRREFGENGNEDCRNSEGGNGDYTECKEISVGMGARTKGNL
jgi:hypothetical protein